MAIEIIDRFQADDGEYKAVIAHDGVISVASHKNLHELEEFLDYLENRHAIAAREEAERQPNATRNVLPVP